MNKCVTDPISVSTKEHKVFELVVENMKISGMRLNCSVVKYVKKKEEQKDRQKEARPDNNSQYLSMNTAALDIKAF